MDHFTDFDWLLRLRVGRGIPLRIFGPAGFIARIESKLSAYSWNLVHNYEDDFVITVTEIDETGHGKRASFSCHNGFCNSGEESVALFEGVLVDEVAFRARCAILEHSIPVLAFCIEEKQHVNVWKNRLTELGLPVGPWLRELKQAVYESKPDDTSIQITGLESQQQNQKSLPLGLLREKVLQIVPGQKIGYVVDIMFNEANCQKAIDLLHGCDHLFIEGAFLQDDANIAAQRKHLTAYQAGLIAGMAQVKRLTPMHFSPRYSDREEALRTQAYEAFQSYAV
jgi:ribonuclease Z